MQMANGFAQAISIHAPRTGSDTLQFGQAWRIWTYFNPRSPHGERRYHLLNLHSVFQFQSTLPARGATPSADAVWRTVVPISIHAPRTGSDPLPPRLQRPRPHFNPRSPHGERRGGAAGTETEKISIHAPRTGSDAGISGGETM